MSNMTDTVHFRKGKPQDIPFIEKKAAEWRLDDERLRADNFLVAEDGDGKIIGFGRIKKYPSCFELGTVGVSPAWRGRGLGKRIVRKLIAVFPADDVWITTDLTGYFRGLGFKIVERGPRELEEKISDACRVKGRICCKIMRLTRLSRPGGIRLARAGDAARCADIFAPYVRYTAITFATGVPSVGEFKKRIVQTLRWTPWLVYERGGTILGYAYASRHRELAAYRWSVDVSIYIDEQYQHRGIGRALYSALFECVKLQGFCNAYAGITLPNPASVGLHEALGFHPIGVYSRVGFKLDAWRDVGWWGLPLAAQTGRPIEPTSLPEALRTPKRRRVIEAKVFGPIIADA